MTAVIEILTKNLLSESRVGRRHRQHLLHRQNGHSKALLGHCEHDHEHTKGVVSKTTDICTLLLLKTKLRNQRGRVGAMDEEEDDDEFEDSDVRTGICE